MRRDERAASRLAVGLLVGIILAEFIVLVLVFKLNDDNAQQTRDIQEGIRLSQFEGCVKSGNVLRDQVREEFVSIKKRVLIPVFEGVAQTLPEGAPQRDILTGAVAYMEHRIRTIDRRIPNANCLELYPPLPGQTYPRSLIAEATEQARGFHVQTHDPQGGSHAKHQTRTPPSPRTTTGSSPADTPDGDSGNGGTGVGGVDTPPSSGGGEPAPPDPTTPPDPGPTPPPPGQPSPGGSQGGVSAGASVGGVSAGASVNGTCTHVNALGLTVEAAC